MNSVLKNSFNVPTTVHSDVHVVAVFQKKSIFAVLLQHTVTSITLLYSDIQNQLAGLSGLVWWQHARLRCVRTQVRIPPWVIVCVITKTAAIYSLHGLHTVTAVLNWLSLLSSMRRRNEYQPSGWVVKTSDGGYRHYSSLTQADSQPRSVGLVWG